MIRTPLPSSGWQARLQKAGAAAPVGAGLVLAAVLGMTVSAAGESIKPSCTIKIDMPSVRLNPIPDRPGAGYLTLTSTCADTFLAASSPQADRVEIHQHIMTGTMMKMVKVSKLDLAPGQTVSFEPMGYHLMIFKVAQPAPKSMTMTLTFAKSAPQTVTFPVK